MSLARSDRPQQPSFSTKRTSVKQLLLRLTEGNYVR
jgi:hypothetical protein